MNPVDANAMPLPSATTHQSSSDNDIGGVWKSSSKHMGGAGLVDLMGADIFNRRGSLKSFQHRHLHCHCHIATATSMP